MPVKSASSFPKPLLHLGQAVPRYRVRIGESCGSRSTPFGRRMAFVNSSSRHGASRFLIPLSSQQPRLVNLNDNAVPHCPMLRVRWVRAKIPDPFLDLEMSNLFVKGGLFVVHDAADSEELLADIEIPTHRTANLLAEARFKALVQSRAVPTIPAKRANSLLQTHRNKRARPQTTEHLNVGNLPRVI